MKNRIGLFLLFLSLAFSCFASAETRWECVDPRDGYKFRFNYSDVKLKRTETIWGGNLTEIRIKSEKFELNSGETMNIGGKVLLVSEYSLYHVFRCTKEEGKSW